MIKFKENAWTDGRTEGQKDRQTLFYRTLSATVGGPKTQKRHLENPTKEKKAKNGTKDYQK